MKIEADWINNPALGSLFSGFSDNGFELYAVGGCVRNTLLGRPITDIDLSTNARPDQVLELAKSLGIRAVPTGIDHGTITLVMDETPYEVTTYRKDIETDGRRAVVAFAGTIEEDSLRRDFTINAIYMDAAGNVTDPQNGMADIDPVRIRFIGDPQKRIREDYLRILRFFRFFAQYGDLDQGFDADGLAACAELLDGLDHISKERIGAEMIKIAAAIDPSFALAGMAHSGVLLRILPGADVSSIPVLMHFEDGPPRFARRLAALGDLDWKSLLRLSNQDAKAIQDIRAAALSDHSAAALGHLWGETVAVDAFLVRSALLQTPPADGYLEEIRSGAAQEFPLTAQDVMPELSGPALGVALRDARAHWIENQFKPTRSDLVIWLKNR